MSDVELAYRFSYPDCFGSESRPRHPNEDVKSSPS
jgi:hypothetical protein